MVTTDDARQYYDLSANRFCDYYLSYTWAHAGDFVALDEEFDNLRHTLESCENMQAWSNVSRLVEALDIYLDTRGYWAEHRYWLEKTIEHGEESSNSTLTEFILSLASIVSSHGEKTKAEKLYLEAVQRAKLNKEEYQLGRAYYGLFTVYMQIQPDKSQDYLKRFIAQAQLTGNPLDSDLGRYFSEIDIDKSPAQTLRRITKHLRGFGHAGKGFSSALSAYVHLRAGNYPQADRQYQAALRHLRRIGDAQGASFVLYQLGLIAALRDNLEAALDYYRQSEAIAKQIGDSTGLTLLYSAIGMIYLRQQKFQLALPFLEWSVLLATNSGDQELIAENLYWLGFAVANTGAPEHAKQIFEQSLKLFTSLKSSRADDVRDTLFRLLAVLGVENDDQLDLNWTRSQYQESSLRFVEHYRTFVRLNQQNFLALKDEIDNVFAAIRLYNELSIWSGVTDLVGDFYDFLRGQGYWSEAIHYGELAVNAAKSLFNANMQDAPLGLDLIRFQCSLAAMLAFQGHYKDANHLLEQAFGISQQMNDEVALAPILQLTGLLAEAKHDHTSAEWLYEYALERIKQTEYLPAIAVALDQLANVAYQRGDYERALYFCREKLPLYRQTGDKAGIVSTLHLLGEIAGKINDLDLAHQLHNDALNLTKSLEQPSLLAETLLNSGHNAYFQEDYETAQNFYSQALEIARRTGDKLTIADVLRRLAFVAEELGHERQSLLEESLQISRELGDQLGIARSLIQLGQVYQDKANYPRAGTLYRQALGIANEAQDQALLAVAWQQMGELAQEQEDWVEAQRCYQEAILLARHLGDFATIALLHHHLGEVLYEQNHFTLAKQPLQESIEINKSLGDLEAVAGSTYLLALALAAEGNPSEARKLCTQSLDIAKEISSPFVEIIRETLEKMPPDHGNDKS